MVTQITGVNFVLNGTITANNASVCNDLLTINSLKVNRTATTIDYTILSSDYLIGVDTTSNVVELTLPLASSVPDQMFNIVDEGGNANANNITITPTGGDTISGESSLVISSAYNSISIYSNGSDWFIF
jgi:hypothetical protein